VVASGAHTQAGLWRRIVGWSAARGRPVLETLNTHGRLFFAL